MEIARQACSFYLARLTFEVSRLRDFVFPGYAPGPRQWLNFISGLIDTAKLYLKLSMDPAATADEISERIQDAEELGDQAYRLLIHASGTDANQIPHQIVAPFQRWVSGLGIKNTIFFRAEHVPNYELATFDLEQWSADLNSPSQSLVVATGAIKWPVLRLTVPSQAMGMLPHFAVIGHELGHAIQNEIKPDYSKHSAAITDCITRIRSRLSGSFGPDDLVRTLTILNSWVNELKADAVGHILSGPAFFFALCGFLELAGQSYGISPSHPPSDLRRKLLLGQLNNGTPSFIDVITKKTALAISETTNSPHIPACPTGDVLFNELVDNLDNVSAAICVELVACLETLADEIYKAAEVYLTKICPELIYTPTQLENDIETHLDLLCDLVPPIEHRDASGVHPALLATILNVGWMALLTRLDKIPEPNDDANRDISAAKMERLHELLLKAVELSEARRLWDESL